MTGRNKVGRCRAHLAKEIARPFEFGLSRALIFLKTIFIGGNMIYRPDFNMLWATAVKCTPDVKNRGSLVAVLFRFGEMLAQGMKVRA